MPIDLSPYQAVLVDLDGTLCFENRCLPGAAEFIRGLEDRRINYACVSNTPSGPRRVEARLAHMGIEIEPDRIYTAGAAAADYVLVRFGRQSSARPRIFNLATSGLQEMLDERVDWVENDGEPCDAVIIGAPPNSHATPERQRLALGFLRKGAAAVGICADRVYPSDRGLELGSGALTWQLAYAAAVQPVFCGKPQESFFTELCHRLGAWPASCLLIGDNLESDIGGAKALGMRTVLTLTGVTRRHHLANLSLQSQPDRVVEDLTELL